MKNYIKIFYLTLGISVLCNFDSFSQNSIKLDELLKLEIKNDDGKIYINSEVNNNNKSKIGVFFAAYPERFDFLLINFPDCPYLFDAKTTTKAEAKQHYLSCLSDNAVFTDAINNLLPAELRTQQTEKKSFTIESVLNIGSRFFYCDNVKPDTSVDMRICVGTNGLAEFTGPEKSLELEAFIYEALFKDLLSDKRFFFDEFYAHLPEFGKQGRKKFTDFDSYLPLIRQMMYDYIKNDPLFKTLIINHYNANRANLNFEIV